jgi:hypothetical protein
MNDANRFLKAATEYLMWSTALPTLYRRIGVATKMSTISDADKADLLAVNDRIKDLIQRAGKAVEAENADDLFAVANELRNEIVNANLILDRLKVPDAEP